MILSKIYFISILSEKKKCIKLIFCDKTILCDQTYLTTNNNIFNPCKCYRTKYTN